MNVRMICAIFQLVFRCGRADIGQAHGAIMSHVDGKEQAANIAEEMDVGSNIVASKTNRQSNDCGSRWALLDRVRAMRTPSSPLSLP